LLEKYDPASLKDKHTAPTPDWRLHSMNSTLTYRGTNPLMSPQQQPSGNMSTLGASSPQRMIMATPHQQAQQQRPAANISIAQRSIPNTSFQPFVPPAAMHQPMQQTLGRMPVMQTQASMTRPIPPQDRSVVEKLVDYV